MGGSASAVEQAVRGLVHGPVLLLSVPAGSTFHTGRVKSLPSSPSTVVIAPPGAEFTRNSPPGSMFAIEAQHRALLDELEARRPAGGASWAGRLTTRELANRDRAGLISAAADLVQATRPGADARQLVLAESRVVELMAGLALLGSEEKRPGELTQARIRDLEGWIEAHLDEPLTLGRLCQAAGVGARCLQKTFEYRRGMSPMRYVTERRLTAAYHLLKHAVPGDSVTRIALELGFGHLGRFAQMYRQVIGESPSQTLASRVSVATGHQTPFK